VDWHSQLSTLYRTVLKIIMSFRKRRRKSLTCYPYRIGALKSTCSCFFVVCQLHE
jgi:hypothetical protein